MTEQVVVVTGSDPAQALDALRTVETIEVLAAAIVHRAADGSLSLDQETGDALSFEERHPRLGALVTLLVGPIDALLFGNQLMSLYGAGEPSEEQLALQHIATAVPPGSSGVIAEIVEDDPAALDAAVPGTVVRRTFAEVEAEIDAARERAREQDQEQA